MYRTFIPNFIVIFVFVLSFLVAIQFELLLLTLERQRFNPLSDCLRVLILVDGFDCSSKRIRISNIYPTYCVMTWDSIPFPSYNHPSRNHPREAARTTLRRRVSILKITISRRLLSFFILFQFFPSSL